MLRSGRAHTLTARYHTFVGCHDVADGGRQLSSVKGLVASVCRYAALQGHLLYTGADNSALKAWDTRCPDSGPVMSNRYAQSLAMRPGQDEHCLSTMLCASLSQQLK